MSANPIPFNPETLTISQAKECVYTLKMVFDALDRDVAETDPHNLIHNMRAWRDSLAVQWQRHG